jgi:hypothetical protein
MNIMYLYFLNKYLYTIALLLIVLIIGFIIGDYYGQYIIVNKLSGYYCTISPIYMVK